MNLIRLRSFPLICATLGALLFGFLASVIADQPPTKTAPPNKPEPKSLFGELVAFVVGGGLLGYFGRYLQYRAEIAKIKGDRDQKSQTLAEAQAERKAEEQRLEEMSRDANAQLDSRIGQVIAPEEEKLKKVLTTLTELTQAVRAQRSSPLRFIVLASGKGGVGKSTLGLGLLEYYSASGRTLLVDFDLPNRGLTSLLHPYLAKSEQYEKIDRTLEAMERFHGETMSQIESDLVKRSMADATGGTNDKEKRRALRSLLTDFYDKYVGHVDPIPPVLYNFGETAKQDVSVPNAPSGTTPRQMTIQSSNAYFMPSVRPGQLFLSSSIFEAQALEVFYFLHTLGRWCLQTKGISTIILDCYGAHDLFMVGAIQAASDLIVTMTPEPGSFDGTLDLLAFAAQSNRAVAGAERGTVTLAINNVGAWQKGCEERLRTFLSDEKSRGFAPDNAVSISNHNTVRHVLSHYEFGKVAKSPLWKSICEIGVFLDQSEKPKKDVPTVVNSVTPKTDAPKVEKTPELPSI